ncbi:hypothetical protein CVT24_007254 [Panaeolus cyanescens]|uniref:Uncharacterized protein n=1 Tax=Panaeolus cyanescens TaxID=181874 RepID=A0A409WLE9_9AGAR|nr:hypothetical protein CVT24_007254 [Panaeolus cyanescens]
MHHHPPIAHRPFVSPIKPSKLQSPSALSLFGQFRLHPHGGRSPRSGLSSTYLSTPTSFIRQAKPYTDTLLVGTGVHSTCDYHLAASVHGKLEAQPDRHVPSPHAISNLRSSPTILTTTLTSTLTILTLTSTLTVLTNTNTTTNTDTDTGRHIPTWSPSPSLASSPSPSPSECVNVLIALALVITVNVLTAFVITLTSSPPYASH